MQYTKEKLAAQQLVLFHLGYYKGLIEGIWGPDSIEAKRQFESDRSFVPGNPNGGLPFGDRDRLPKGMSYNRGLVVHSGLTDERKAEIETAMKARGADKNPQAQPATLPKLEEASVVENGESPESTEPETEVEPKAKFQQANQQQKQKGHQHQHKRG